MNLSLESMDRDTYSYFVRTCHLVKVEEYCCCLSQKTLFIVWEKIMGKKSSKRDVVEMTSWGIILFYFCTYLGL